MSIVSSLLVSKKGWISFQFTSVFCEGSGSCLAHGKYLNVCKVCVRHSKSPIYSATFEIVYIMTLVSRVPKLQLAVNEQFLVSCKLDRKRNKQGPNTHIQDAGDAC